MNKGETERLKEVYDKRKSDSRVQYALSSSVYNGFIANEREHIYQKVLTEAFNDLQNINLLEIGAGNGSNLHFFARIGIPWKNIYANELLDDRVEQLNKIGGGLNVIPGDALKMKQDQKFDIVFQSTVFTSILDPVFKASLANKMVELTRPGGMVLWYDFIYNNPSNKNVRGVSKDEIKKLFPSASSITFYTVTLAPPIGRRVGKLYNFFNFFRFLRTHVVAVIEP